MSTNENVPVRGGSWDSYRVNARCAYRLDLDADFRSYLLGFRPVFDTRNRCVVRGGSWGSSARWLRSVSSLYYHPGDRVDNTGFRLVFIVD